MEPNNISPLLTGGCVLTLLIVYGTLAVAIIVALVHLVRKTKQEKLEAKLEIGELVNSLPSEKQGTFLAMYNAERKNPTTAVVLALLLGWVGGHKFYLGQTGLGILYLLFSWTSIPLIVSFVEAFTISRKVYRLNREAAREAAVMLGGSPQAFLDKIV